MIVLSLYVFGHRVAEIWALQAAFDDRYSRLQIKRVRDARTQSEPQQCVHLCRYFYLTPAVYRRERERASPFRIRFPPADSTRDNPRSCHANPLSSPSATYAHTASKYTHNNPLHTLSTFLKTHYIPILPTHARRAYFQQCRQHVTSLRNRNVPRKAHHKRPHVLMNYWRSTSFVEIPCTEIDQSEQRSSLSRLIDETSMRRRSS